MTEEQFNDRWAKISKEEAAKLSEAEARERERFEARLEKSSDKIRELYSRPRALLIHEALTPDAHGRALKQERLAELTGMDQTSVSHHAAFGHLLVYIGSPNIKPTLQQPSFFSRLTLSAFLRLLQKTESQVGPRAGWENRRQDYERRFREMIDHANAGAGQVLSREEVYKALEMLAGRKKPTPLTAILQHLEQQNPDRAVNLRDIKNAVGSFKNRGDYYTETIESVSGPAVRIRKLNKVDPMRAQATVVEVVPLLEEVLELSGRTTAQTSLTKISANVQKVLRALKDLQSWAETRPQ